MEIDVTNNLTDSQFQAEVDGHLAIIRYTYEEGALVLTHTEVPGALEGRGIGSRLVRAALDFARAEGLEVVPKCPFVAAYIKKHEEYRSLVSSA